MLGSFLLLVLVAQGAWAASAPPGMIRSALGVTRDLKPIECWLAEDDLDFNTRKTRVLLLGAAAAVEQPVTWFYTAREARRWRQSFAVSAALLPDMDLAKGYPPQGEAYGRVPNPEAAYLWRWIGMHAPDLVVEIRPGEKQAWQVPESLRGVLPGGTIPASDDLVSQVARTAPSGAGVIPALRVSVPSGAPAGFLGTLLAALEKSKLTGPSPARSEIQRRVARAPLEVARQLSVPYGHQLEQAVYIPAIALIGRLRLGEITKDPRHLAEVESIAAPYLDGRKAALEKPTGSHLSGHLVFGELFRLTKKPGYLQLAQAAADLGFDERGNPKESMPLHSEMSDSVFMGCPILAQVGRLTGNQKYLDMSLRHMRFMLKLNLRPDGLHRHSPLDPTAWGRGNGFPALGLALTLTDLPANHPGREEMLRAFRAHLEALSPHQDPTGAWHQVIDFPGSYRELTATCMIGFAMVRGVRSGWLDRRQYEPRIARAWYAVKTRAAPNGDLVDVCTSTGKQRSLREYLDRAAILGPDPRGGAMALLFATEMAQWELERKPR